jgi:hypothetical protein
VTPYESLAVDICGIDVATATPFTDDDESIPGDGSAGGRIYVGGTRPPR